MNSSLPGASIRAQPAPALSWPHLRFLHHSLICSPLESLVLISTSYLVPFIRSTHALSRSHQPLLDRFIQDPCCSGCQCLCLHPLQRLSAISASCLESSIHSTHCLCCPPADPSGTVRARMLQACFCQELLTTTQLFQYLIHTIQPLGLPYVLNSSARIESNSRQ